MTSEPQRDGKLDLAEFGRLLDQSISTGGVALAKARTSAAQDPARVWLALTPGWTVPLADRCSLPGSDRESAAAILDRFVQDNVAKVFPFDDEPGDRPGRGYYVMTPAARAETLRAYLALEPDEGASSDPPSGRMSRAPNSPILKAIQSAAAWLRPEVARSATSLLQTAAQVGASVHKVGTDTSVPQMVRDWSELAIHAGDAKAASKAFDAKVTPAINAKDMATIRDWIEVARPLAVLFEYAGDTDLSLAIASAGRAIELTKRRDLDYRHLESFHRRDEQVEAIRALLDGPDDQWALHIIGPGGVGKTMAVRYATCLMTHTPNSPCSGDPRPFTREAAVARLDFDYLNLDYPRLNPGLLLVDLAAELRASGSVTTNKLFDRAEDEFRLLNEAQKAEGLRRERATLDRRMAAGIRAYIEALRSIDKPVVLILDTCEELAKIDPDGGDNSSLEETFRILRALHDGPDTLADADAPPGQGVPSLRVIFSGRRALAASGAGWQAPDSTLPIRPYLLIHEVRGFTHDETEGYLKREGVPKDLVDPVIKASSPGLRTSIRIDYDDSDDGPRDVPRCNPYQVRLYLDWARSVPPPDPDVVATGGSGRYVELRLIQRLHDEGLERVLPRVAVLAHFDLPTFLAATHLDLGEGERQFRSLADQEWIGMHRSSGEPPREILDLSPDVRDLLVRYYADRARPRPSELEPGALAIEELTIEGDLDAIDWADFDCGLRVLAHDPARGATWWALVEHRLFAERPGWVPQLLDRVLSSEGAAHAIEPDDPVGVIENPLRPFVLATQVRLLQAAGNGASLEAAWRDIVEATRARRDTPPFDRLYRRALAGHVAATRYGGAAPSMQLVHEFWTAWQAAVVPLANAQDAAAMLAAVETLIDFAELDRPTNLALLRLPRPAADPEHVESRASDGLDTGFRPSVNGWQFTNSFPSGPVLKLAGVNFGDAARGLSAGMAVAALDLWMSGVAPPSDPSAPANGSPEFAYLARREVDVLGPAVQSRARPGRRSGMHPFQAIWPEVRTDLEAGRPVPLELRGGRSQSSDATRREAWRHHVVAFAASESADHVTIGIYDPNRPADDTVELVVTFAPDGEAAVDHPDLGPVQSMDRVPYTHQRPGPWDGQSAMPVAVPMTGLTVSGPGWVAAEVERTHLAWMTDADGQTAAIDALRSMFRMQAGRAALLADDLVEGMANFATSLDLIPPERPAAAWADWRPPRDVATRVRLEVARAAYPALMSAEDTLALIGAVDLDTSTADGDRLASTLLDMKLAGPLRATPEQVVTTWHDTAKWQPLLAPNVALTDAEPINAHRLVPPLFVRVSELQVAFGMFAQARRHLETATTAAGSAGDVETMRSADRALLRMSRRLRSIDERESSTSSLAASPRIEDKALIGSLAGMAGPTRPVERGSVPPLEAHPTWRSGWAVDLASAQDLVRWGSMALVAALAAVPDDDGAREMLSLDLRELVALTSEYVGVSEGHESPLDGEMPAGGWRAWSIRHPGLPETALRLRLRDAVLDADESSIDEVTLPFDIVHRLGPRRCADIAFDEAEALALRLPRAAIPILLSAGTLYAQSHDTIGAFWSATLAALLLTPRRLDEGSDASRAETQLMTTRALSAYKSMAVSLGRAAGSPTLATVPELDAIAEAPSDAAFESLEPVELRPWLARLIACLAIRSGENDTDAAFSAWVEGRYGVTVGERAALPTEWTRYVLQRQASPTIAAAPAVMAASSESLVGRIASILGAGIVGIGFLFAAWLFAVGYVWPEVTSIGLIAQFGLFALTGAILAILFWAGRRAFDSVKTITLGWSRLDVDIAATAIDEPGAADVQPGSSDVSPAGAGRVAVLITPTMWLVRPVRARPPMQLRPYRTYPSERLVVSDLDAYDVLAKALPDGLKHLVETEIPLVRPPWLVQLIPRGDLQRLNWEAMLTLGTASAQAAPTDAPIRVTRIADSSRPHRRRRTSGALVGESIAADDVAAGVVRRALEKSSSGKVSWSVVSAPRTQKDASPNVVHVIGTTVEDHGGRALRLTPIRAYGSQITQKSTPSGPGEGSSAQSLRPEDLGDAYPDAMLFIVQGYPPEEAIERVGSDRELANQTRLFAAELARLGAPVIVIPPLKPAHATAVWDLVNRAVPGFLKRGPEAMVPAVTKAQATILTSERRRDAWELALDLCVIDVPPRSTA